MSDTAIEDLIEDGVAAILASEALPKEKRGIIRALYAFQERFDTSFTMLRHSAGLRAIGFQEPSSTDGLLPEEPFPSWSLSELAWKNVELCPVENRGVLAVNWYSALVSRYLEFDLEEEFLAGFDDLEADESLQRLRAFAIESGLAEQRKSPGALFRLASWASERPLLDSEQIDRYHITRYLLDLKSDLAKVRRAYQKDLRANSPEARAAFYDRVEEALVPTLEKTLSCRSLPRIESRNEITWCFYRDRLDGVVVDLREAVPKVTPGFQREIIRVKFIPGLNGLEVTTAVQNGQVLAWQQAQPHTDSAFWHFYSNIFADIEPETKTYKTLTSFGLWPIKSGMSQKKEAESLSALAEQIEELAPKVFDMYFNEFNYEFFQRKLEWFQECWEEIVPTEALVSFLGDALLLQAFHARSEGREDDAQFWFDSAEESIKRSREGSPVRLYLVSRLAEMRRDPDAPLTLMIHRDSLELLSKQAD